MCQKSEKKMSLAPDKLLRSMAALNRLQPEPFCSSRSYGLEYKHLSSQRRAAVHQQVQKSRYIHVHTEIYANPLVGMSFVSETVVCDRKSSFTRNLSARESQHEHRQLKTAGLGASGCRHVEWRDDGLLYSAIGLNPHAADGNEDDANNVGGDEASSGERRRDWAV